MRSADVILFSWQAIVRNHFRSLMILLAMSLGVGSVVVLTALGEGARGYVMEQFSFLGKDILIVFPGKKETTGGLPPVMGTAARDITLSDVKILARRMNAVIEEVSPLVIGTAEVSYQQLARETLILGSNASFVDMRQLTLSKGRNISSDDFTRDNNECIIGSKTYKELFKTRQAVGELIRVGDYRCRVVGILAGRGDAMGMDLSDGILMPVVAAQQLFNIEGLFRLLVRIKPGVNMEKAKQQLITVFKDLHQGEEDVTVISPDAMLASFNEILIILTLGVGAIGAISLLVAGVLIMNITLIGISQRTKEIGLLKALGASSHDVLKIFVTESILITLLGSTAGLLTGLGLVSLLAAVFPDIPFAAPLWALLTATLVSIICGIGFAWLPAQKASGLLPVDAMQG
jgi:putative ABC transport system permease protein